jgi:dolichol-phosphate mannosyltransferase
VSLQTNLCEMERTREAYWLCYPQTSPVKLRWRALTVRHCLHVLPDESILELGAGSGLWTEHLATVFRGENPITAAVFNDEFAAGARNKNLPNVRFVRVHDLAKDLPHGQFDYVIGTAILCHNLYAQNLAAIHSLLKPGGQILFFEANYWNPQVFLKSTIRAVGKWSGNADCQVGMRKYHLLRSASHEGFTNVDIIPYDIVHPLTPRPLVRWIRDLAFLLEQTPIIRDICGTLYIWAKKPQLGRSLKPKPQLTVHEKLFGSTSVVIPCHNEEMNVRPLVSALLQMYGKYLHEIILVNDNSTDGTAEVVRAMSQIDPRIKLLNRKPPAGVGRALRDGVAAASGRYILMMDCDFVQIAPELRDLFDAIASGHDGAIGSRFSHESVLINYPIGKVICNRGFHFLMSVLLWKRMRDVSNNLKLMRADILKSIAIEENHFAANVETGLKPILAGYDIKEVPISWVNRTTDMGQSSFRVLRVAPRYAFALLRIVWNARLRRTAMDAQQPSEVLKKAASR